MLDERYSKTESQGTIYPDTVLIGVASSPRLVLTKRQISGDEFHSYDRVKHFDFYERNIDNLLGLYRLLKSVVNYPRAALIRAVLKDKTNWKHIERKAKGEDSTLVGQDQHWFALDIDGFAVSSGDLEKDARLVLKELGEEDVECIALASSSYGYKRGIHIRLFLWSENKVSGYSLQKFFYNNKVKADLAMFNPIQLIYVAKPILLGPDRVSNRLLFINNEYPTILIPEVHRSNEGGYEDEYTKQQADVFYEKIMETIQFAEEGSRHTTLYNQACFLGKLIYQGLLDEQTVLDDVETICQYEWGSNTLKKDMDTFQSGIRRGGEAMQEQEDF